MELNEEVKFLLDLKFDSLESMVKAFKSSINAPAVFAKDHGVRQEVLMRAVSMWAQEGAPSKLEITEKNVDLILEVKFGSLQQAYTHWKMQDYTTLTPLEYFRLIDYVPKDL